MLSSGTLLAGGVVTVADQAHLAAALSGGGTVTFGVNGTILLTNTITISANSVLDGTGHTVAISGNSAMRAFTVSPGIVFTLLHLGIVDGRKAGTNGAPGVAGETANGGGVYNNSGTLNVIDCTFARNSAIGGNGGNNPTGHGGDGGPASGGAIYNNAGALNVTNCTFATNSVLGGAGAGGSLNSGGFGADALGGAICSLNGTLRMTGSQFVGNGATSGQNGADPIAASQVGNAIGGGLASSGTVAGVFDCAFSNNTVSAPSSFGVGGGGGASHGGGIAQTAGSLVLTRTILATNSAVGGQNTRNGAPGAGAGGGVFNGAILNVTNCQFLGNSAVGGLGGSNGNNGTGGGLFNLGTTTVYGSLFCGNSTRGGVGIGSAIGVTPSGHGYGGAILNSNLLVLNASTLSSNTSYGGSGRSSLGGAPSAGGSAFGGGLFNAGVCYATNNTLAANLAQGMAGGVVIHYIAPGGNAIGGGIYNLGGTVTVSHATSFGNKAVGGVGDTNTMGASIGGGVASSNGPVILYNSIVAGSTSGSNCWGTITDGGGNLSSDSSGAFSAPKSLNNADPLLGPLDDYGGPTPTMPLLAGSPAIDGADIAFCPATDQRGIVRPFGAACDIGAFESAPPYTIQGKVEGFRLTEEIHLAAGAAEADSSASGHYMLRGLGTGSYPVTPSLAGFRFAPSNPLVSVGPDRVGVDFKAYRLGALAEEPSTNGWLLLTFAGTNGQTYRVESSTNFVGWTPISTNQVGANGLFQVPVAPVAGARVQTFRAVGQ